jgi:hypothetical protein
VFKCRRFISGAPELQDLYLGQNAMHTVRRGVARDLLLLPHHVGQLSQFSHLSVLELGGFICSFIVISLLNKELIMLFKNTDDVH